VPGTSKYQRQREQSHPATARALAYESIRIIFRCWKDGKPYDEQIYLQSLQRRRSPLGAFATGLGGGGRSLVFKSSLEIPLVLDGLRRLQALVNLQEQKK
jgi:hypothetical protein